MKTKKVLAGFMAASLAAVSLTGCLGSTVATTAAAPETTAAAAEQKETQAEEAKAEETAAAEASAAADMKYIHIAEESLCGELAISLDMDKDEVKNYIATRVDDNLHIA